MVSKVSAAFASVLLAVALATPVSSASIFSPSWATTKKLIATRFPGAKQISTTDFAEWLIDHKQEKKPIILDVRTAEEFAVSHLAVAVRAGDLQEAKMVLQGRALDAPIVVYCSVGYRSSAMAVQLTTAGYTNVQNLDGSIFQWANEGRSVFSGKTMVATVHPYNSTWGDLLAKKYWSKTP